MPVVRRSRRLSKQNSVDGCGWDWESNETIYPERDTFASRTPAPAMPTPLTASTMLSATNRKVIAECPAVTTFFPEVSPKHPTRTSVHNRKRNNDHIPRPPNAFLVFRSFLWANRSGRGAGADHRDVSCLAGEKWRAFSARDREPFEEVATLAKARHSELYPHYKYAPSGKKAKSVKRKMKRGGTEEARCNKVALLLMQGMQGTALEEEMEKCDISDGSESRDDSPQTFYTALSSPSSLPPPTPIQDTDFSSATTSPLPFIASEREASRASPSTLEFHGYVPTEQIPPLDLNMSTLCKEEENTFVDTFDYLVDPNQCLAGAYSAPLLPHTPNSFRWEHALKPERQQMDPPLFQLPSPSTPESTLSSPISFDDVGFGYPTSTDFSSSPDVSLFRSELDASLSPWLNDFGFSLSF